jgi:hypothetical protein
MINKKILFRPLTIGLLTASVFPISLSLTSCNNDKFTETTIVMDSGSLSNYFETNHAEFDDPITSLTSNDLKNYFFKENRLPGKNLILTSYYFLSQTVSTSENTKVKFSYNSNTCNVKLESNVESKNGSHITKSGSYANTAVKKNYFKSLLNFITVSEINTINANTIFDVNLDKVSLKVNLNELSDDFFILCYSVDETIYVPFI